MSLINIVDGHQVSFLARKKQRVRNKKCAGYFNHFSRLAKRGLSRTPTSVLDGRFYKTDIRIWYASNVFFLDYKLLSQMLEHIKR